MADDNGRKSLAQQYHEDVEAFKADGMTNADAIKAVAGKYDKTENAVRSSLHQYRTRNGLAGSGGGGRRGRRASPASVDDHIASARKALEDALALIDREVDDARSALDIAKARYDEVNAAVKDRKADLEKKIKALA